MSFAVVLACLCGFAAADSMNPAAASGPALTPAQSAWLGVEIRRANDLFVKRVVAITSMPPDTVRQAIPAEGRITDPAARTVSAIEKFGGKPLGDEQKTAVRAAEEDRRQMIATARAQAGKK
jgi:hypothetical protein